MPVLLRSLRRARSGTLRGGAMGERTMAAADSFDGRPLGDDPPRCAAGTKGRPHSRATCGTASPVSPRRPVIDPRAVRPEVGRPHRSGPETEGVEVVQATLG